MKMYLVVEIKNGEIIWSDSAISSSKEEALTRKNFIQKHNRTRKFEIMRVSQLKKLVA